MTLNLCSSTSRFLSDPILIINSNSLSLILSLISKSDWILLSRLFVVLESCTLLMFQQIIHVLSSFFFIWTPLHFLHDSARRVPPLSKDSVACFRFSLYLSPDWDILFV